MTGILKFALILLAIWFAVSLVSLLWRRIKLYRKIFKLRSVSGAEVKFLKLPLLSLFRLSSTPEISVKLGGAQYLVRIFNGGGIGKVVHFATAEYAVRFSRFRISAYVKLRGREKLVNARSGFAVGTKVIRVPKMNTSGIAPTEDVRTVEVMIFNPASGEVSFVTEEKTSIRVAFTGDDVLGTRIFTAGTFVNYVEREHRREQFEKEKGVEEERREAVAAK